MFEEVLAGYPVVENEDTAVFAALNCPDFFFLLSRMLGTAAKLYLVCLILHTYVFQEMHIPFWLIAVGSVALVWIYTHKSGIKTIVWTANHSEGDYIPGRFVLSLKERCIRSAFMSGDTGY